MRAAPPRRESYQRAQSPPRSSGRAVNASRARHAPWLLLSRISPARRVVLLLVAVFDIAEVVLLSKRGIQQHDAVALTLGVIVLVLLLVFEVAEHAAALRDDELSREISEWLLPHAPRTLQGLEVAFSNRMANHVGSDYFNVFPRWTRTGGAHSHRVFIVMADVAGTGLQGALLMATFQASLRALADSSLPLHELASELNQWCWDRSLEGRHFTMAFLADLDPVTGRWTTSRQGTSLPWSPELLAGSSTWRWLGSHLGRSRTPSTRLVPLRCSPRTRWWSSRTASSAP
jgi:sigma-B regulation protein RsbU (phosphoserine phosphatase)